MSGFTREFGQDFQDEYDEMRRKLADPKDWDVAGTIADVRTRLCNSLDAESVAVIDDLLQKAAQGQQGVPAMSEECAA